MEDKEVNGCSNNLFMKVKLESVEILLNNL
jgi:hypothetical protein